MTKIVELQIEDETEEGIYAISIVDLPAIESNFIALSKGGKDEKSQYSLAAIDEDKKILIGAALIPNKLILRLDRNDDPYYIHFSKDTVAKAAHNFLKYNAHHNHTLQHEEQVEGLYVAESWIVEDKESDKSTKYGLDVPTGTWMTIVKVDNDDVWNEQVKTGKVRGFSIEAYFAPKLGKVKSTKFADELLSAANKVLNEQGKENKKTQQEL